MSRASIYDEVSFPSFPYSHSHPERLATMARLCGLQTTAPNACRVLELGCGAGGNLLPMADTLPNSQFVGIDLSDQQIALAQETLTAVGLSNVQLYAKDILNLDDSIGRFDYVIAHGLFSWTSEPVRDKILSLLSQVLTTNGVAYINYNTYPGWHVQGMLRDMLYFHARSFSEPADRVRAARQMIDFLRQTLPTATTPFGALVRSELEAIQKTTDAYLFHAYLNVINQPFYLYEVQKRSAGHGLHVFADADPALAWPEHTATPLLAPLKTLTDDASQWPQLFDFVKSTTSRRSLFCHQNSAVERGPRWDILPDLYFSGHLLRTDGAPGSVTFATPSGRRVATSEPRLQATLEILSERWPESLPYDHLAQHVRKTMAAQQQPDEKWIELWQRDLMQCFCNNVIELSINPYLGVKAISQQPVVTRLARFQATHADFVANLRHQAVRLSEPDRRCLAILDGTRTVEQLTQDLQADPRESLNRLSANALLLA